MQWISVELNELRLRSSIAKHLNFNIHIYITQEGARATTSTLEPHPLDNDKAADLGVEPFSEVHSLSSRLKEDPENPNFKVSYLNSCHPSLQNIVSNFVDTRASFDYRTRVIASGPAGMGYDLRAVVAGLNDGGKVWKGDRKFDVDLHWDDRMG